MRVSFTGHAGPLTQAEHNLVRGTTQRHVKPHDGLVIKTGAAHGVDTAAAVACLGLYPDARHELYVPGAGDLWHNVELPKLFIDMMRAGWNCHVIMVPGTYMDRNDRLAETDLMLAFPHGLHEVTRSGTWATVRRGRRANADVRVTSLQSAA